MSPPLAILPRHSATILLRRRQVTAPTDTEERGPSLRFSTVEDADAYLSFWLGDGGAMSRLRHVLRELGRAGAVSRNSDREVVHALAVDAADGALELVEHDSPHSYLDVRTAFRRAAAREAAARAARSATRAAVGWPASAVAAPPSAPPGLLPLLEEARIEGAQVMPEILQTLEQIDASLGSLQLASVSLEPTPTGVPAISDAMTKASDTVTTTIDEM
jgi:hypothetical protein